MQAATSAIATSVESIVTSPATGGADAKSAWLRRSTAGIRDKRRLLSNWTRRKASATLTRSVTNTESTPDERRLVNSWRWLRVQKSPSGDDQVNAILHILIDQCRRRAPSPPRSDGVAHKRSVVEHHIHAVQIHNRGGGARDAKIGGERVGNRTFAARDRSTDDQHTRRGHTLRIVRPAPARAQPPRLMRPIEQELRQAHALRARCRRRSNQAARGPHRARGLYQQNCPAESRLRPCTRAAVLVPAHRVVIHDAAETCAAACAPNLALLGLSPWC